MVWMLCWVNGAFFRLVAGAVQADHQAVADQHVVADALDLDQVLDARKGIGLGGHEREEPCAGQVPGAF